MRTHLRKALAGIAAVMLAVGPVPGGTGAADEAAASSDKPTMTWHNTRGEGKIPLKRVTLSSVFSKANRKATYGKDCKVEGLKSTPSVRWCFKSGDRTYPYWTPQGVTSDSDAYDDEDWNGHKGLMVSWYNTNKAVKGVRVTLLDTKTKKYRHLLLVVPKDGGKDYGPLRQVNGNSLHAGGIVWYGEKLYVADTEYGARVFDLRHVYDLAASGSHGDVTDSDKIGRHGDTYYAYKYRYVVPQAGYWKSPKSPGEKKPGEGCTANGPIHNSWMSLDRSSTPDRLVIGEYCVKGDANAPGRMAIWDMKNHDIASHNNVATASQVLTLPAINEGTGTNAQGGLTTDGGYTWFFSISHKHAKGDLLKYRRKDTPSGPFWDHVGTKDTPQGPEDLTFRYRHDKRLIYSVSEYAKYRIIYARNSYSGW